MSNNATRESVGAETDFIKGDSDNLVMLGHPMIDSMMQMIVALGAEVWSGQQRARVTEKLLATHGKVTPAMIEQYVPTPEDVATWAAERKAMVRRVYSVMARNDATARPVDSPHPNLDRR